MNSKLDLIRILVEIIYVNITKWLFKFKSKNVLSILPPKIIVHVLNLDITNTTCENLLECPHYLESFCWKETWNDELSVQTHVLPLPAAWPCQVSVSRLETPEKARHENVRRVWRRFVPGREAPLLFNTRESGDHESTPFGFVRGGIFLRHG